MCCCYVDSTGPGRSRPSAALFPSPSPHLREISLHCLQWRPPPGKPSRSTHPHAPAPHPSRGEQAQPWRRIGRRSARRSWRAPCTLTAYSSASIPPSLAPPPPPPAASASSVTPTPALASSSSTSSSPRSAAPRSPRRQSAVSSPISGSLVFAEFLGLSWPLIWFGWHSTQDFDKVWPIFDSAQSREFRKVRFLQFVSHFFGL